MTDNYFFLEKDSQFENFPTQYIEIALPKKNPDDPFKSIDAIIIDATSKAHGFRLFCNQFKGDIQKQIDSKEFPFLGMLLSYLKKDANIAINYDKIQMQESAGSPF